MIWPRSSRRASLPLNRPATFRLRVEEPSSSVCRPGPFWLLRSAGSSVECVPDLPSYGRGNDQGNDQTDPGETQQSMTAFRSGSEGSISTDAPPPRPSPDHRSGTSRHKITWQGEQACGASVPRRASTQPAAEGPPSGAPASGSVPSAPQTETKRSELERGPEWAACGTSSSGDGTSPTKDSLPGASAWGGHGCSTRHSRKLSSLLAPWPF
jgi:hypothetical protein